ncbi:ABC transporter ATP-binding protein [Rhizobium sp. R72]|uniref:ABC transporter ATP-binding protein n=1 Tax=unclassified Rhizobium TaxID=2613769 RepID=UPI000B538A21|nr:MULTISPECIES: ABC transporter ATP-binding protein [unclassified Rhizobium]OWV98646.1 ABC transporter ATP-binding protein [Rhizobium sp. R72]OWV98680.1 ABC transporter ATP-binding protein [Rhizobium sp. R711]
MTSTVCLKNVSKLYKDVHAIEDVSFSLEEGELVALVGHNGAGKTTLIKAILGLIRPTGGTVRVLGEDPVSGNLGVRKDVGYLPESVSFHLALTGKEILSFYARLKRVPMSGWQGLFDRVGLAKAAADRPVRTYSKGMRQRLGLAQALLGEPRLLLLDEPTSGLDPALRRSFYDLILEFKRKGTTVLLSSHALSELEERAERVVIVNRGRKIADGSLDELRQIACLPTHIRFKPSANVGVDQWSRGSVKWLERKDKFLEANIDHREKIAVISAVTSDPDALTSMTIIEPTLDDVYAHFLQGQGRKP